MLGTGAIADGQMIIMSGTWGLHQVFLDHAVRDGTVGFVCNALTPNRWIIARAARPRPAASNGSSTPSCAGRAAPSRPTRSTSAATPRSPPPIPRIPPVYFLPFLNGAYDNANARASLIGFATWHQLGHAVRAIYEGVAFEHRRHYERLIKAFPRPTHARFCGGAVRSRPWAEIFASALDLTLEVPKGAEFGARGAAMLAGVACGLLPDIAAAAAAMTGLSHAIAPDPRLREILDRRYPAYRRLHAALADHSRDTAG